MEIASSIRILVAALAATGVVSSSALAAGEPKNGYPFTRPAVVRVVLATSTQLGASHAISGEPKNVLPFTRR
jgi:hypothetical protein